MYCRKCGKFIDYDAECCKECEELENYFEDKEAFAPPGRKNRRRNKNRIRPPRTTRRLNIRVRVCIAIPTRNLRILNPTRSLLIRNLPIPSLLAIEKRALVRRWLLPF